MLASDYPGLRHRMNLYTCPLYEFQQVILSILTVTQMCCTDRKVIASFKKGLNPHPGLPKSGRSLKRPFTRCGGYPNLRRCVFRDV